MLTLQVKTRSTPVSALECFAAILLAALLMTLVDSFTAVMPPKWDPESYVDMARNGVWGNDHLVAPFAYRPGMPWLARQVSDLLSLPLADGFLWVSRFSAAAFLFMAYLLARRFTDSRWKAAVPMLFAAAFVVPLKVSLFVPTSVDVAAYPIMLLAVWAFVGGRLGLCLAISAVGLFFKEFIAIPLLLCLAEYFLRWQGDRTPRRATRAWAFAGACLLAAAVILIPRLGLRVVETHQEIDPLNNIHSLSRLVMNPLSPGRDINILFCIVDFWLPFLLLWTRARGREVWRALQALTPLKFYFALFLAMNLLLVMYGGTNISTFVSYSAPVQIALLTLLLAQGKDPVRPVEWMTALAFVVVYNRVFFAIPLPDEGFDAYNDFYAGWGSHVNLATLRRSLEMLGYGALMIGLRWALRRVSPPALPA